MSPLSSARAAGSDAQQAATPGATFSADPVGAVAGSLASIWGGVAGLLQGQQQRKLLEQQSGMQQYQAIIGLSQQQQAAKAQKQMLIIGVSVVIFLAGLAVFVVLIIRKTPK